MAQYKVPQDVEAEDKLLGPFTFRQFIYLMIIGGLIGLGVLFWQVFPPLIIVLIPPILLLGALALPLKKDQPMETYLSAVVSFYLKPHTRTWEPGEPESTIIITAPKKIEEIRTKNLDQDEALHRLSFLADIIDSEGYAIKGVIPNSGIKDEIYAEANDTLDMFEDPTASNNSINQTLQNDASMRRNQAINQMRAAINNTNQTRNATQTNDQQIPPYQQPMQQPQATPIAQIPPYQQPMQQPAQQPQATPVAQIPPYQQPMQQPQVAPVAQIPPYQQPIQQPQVAPITQNPPYQQPMQPTAIPQPPSLPQSETANMPMPSYVAANPTPISQPIKTEDPLSYEAVKNNDTIIKPDSMVAEIEAEKAEEAKRRAEEEKSKAEAEQAEELADPNIINLANNNDFSIETIAKQAKRIKEKKDDEVYISLH